MKIVLEFDFPTLVQFEEFATWRRENPDASGQEIIEQAHIIGAVDGGICVKD